MNEIDVFDKLNKISAPSQLTLNLDTNPTIANKIAEHKIWLQNIKHERPNPASHFKIAVYIRYFNQTKYENYLDYHKKQYRNTLSLCPNWEIVDFYIDEGATAPNMETAPEWSRLLTDCFAGKVDLIITQKVSNVSKKAHEITFCARMLATQPHPIGIYFVSEDIYTLASYYQKDLKDSFLLPSFNQEVLEHNSQMTVDDND